MEAVVVDSLVVVVDGNRQHFLGVVLSYHVLVEVCTDLNTHTDACRALLRIISNRNPNSNP